METRLKVESGYCACNGCHKDVKKTIQDVCKSSGTKLIGMNVDLDNRVITLLGNGINVTKLIYKLQKKRRGSKITIMPAPQPLYNLPPTPPWSTYEVGESSSTKEVPSSRDKMPAAPLSIPSTVRSSPPSSGRRTPPAAPPLRSSTVESSPLCSGRRMPHSVPPSRSSTVESSPPSSGRRMPDAAPPSRPSTVRSSPPSPPSPPIEPMPPLAREPYYERSYAPPQYGSNYGSYHQDPYYNGDYNRYPSQDYGASSQYHYESKPVYPQDNVAPCSIM